MKVVWVTSFYNSAHLIPTFFSCLEKLEPQPSLYLFSENNSTDNTAKLLNEFPHPKKVYRLNYAKDFVQKTNGETPLAMIRQMLLKRLRLIDDLDYAIFCDSDVFVRSQDAIDILTTYGVDCIASCVPRVFPEGLFISAKWKHPHLDNAYQMKPRITEVFDDTPEMVGFGLVALSRKVVMDDRINFYPLLPSLTKDRVTGNDFGYCIRMKEADYKVCLESLVECEHVIYDYHHETKAWTVGGKKRFEFA